MTEDNPKASVQDLANQQEQSPSDLVLCDRRGAVEWIKLNRPEKLNALSTGLVAGLSAALKTAEEDPDVKVVVLTGDDKSFSVGYDIAEEVEAGISEADEWHAALAKNIALTMQVWEFGKPVIGAVSGWCLAGACELAMACDVLVAAEGAQFGEPEIRFGSGPVTLLMPFVVGQKKTNELLLSGDTIDATVAREIGMVNRVVAPSELHGEVTRLAGKFALTPLRVLEHTKRTLRQAYEAKGLTVAVRANLDVAAVLNGVHTAERAEFNRLVAETGLRSALAWRDARFNGFD